MIKRSKYGNRKCTYNGIVFDSQHELNRYRELLLMEKAKVISNLELQVPFELIPEQREESTERYKAGPNKGRLKPGKLIERACVYYADFAYWEDGRYVVEDTKGMKTKEYLIKRKLMLYRHGIRIQEI